MALTTSFSSSSSTATSHRPWPPLLRLVAALLLTGVLSLFLTSSTLAQTRKKAAGGGGGGGTGYRTGIGLRAGSPSGVTLKHFYKGPLAVEGIIGTNFNRRGINLTVLIEKHGRAFQARGLNYYYGFGGHISSYARRYYYDWYYVKYKGNRYFYRDAEYYENGRFWGVGIDGVLGLEYQFADLPFTLGVDAKPFAELTRGEPFFGVDGAVSLRYVF